ncbi:MAG: hypothetical protein DIU71_08245 [Proteobacteria bacterium]|nr:MAG: hypothetical protein DIU71_08245 [Pseudomonadota bacterium]
MRTFQWIIAAAVAASLAGCGADEISSAGSGGTINITNPPPTTPAPGDPGPQDPNLAVPAEACPAIADPAGLDDYGTITGPTGTYRVCALPSRFTVSTTLPRVPGVLYAMDGRVDVGDDLGAEPTPGEEPVVLTIEPGVVIFAHTGVSWLAVNRGNRIEAEGTAERPIVFTSRDNVLGFATDDSQGQWGGVVLLGRAPITDCTIAPDADPGTVECERQTEGATDPAHYGGELPEDNSGTLRYVQIRYSGYVLSANNELQALTLSGVGSGTTIEYVQSHNSSDDGFENFGGTAHMRRIVVTGADDDSMDLDTGYRGTIQYAIVVQKTSGGADSLIELDSANALEDQTPRTHLKLANFTLIHRNPASGNNAAMLFRGKADATLVNGIVTSPMPCLRLHGSNILTADPATDKLGPPVFHSVVMQCAPGTPFVGTGGVTDTQVADVFDAGANNDAGFTATLADTFVNGANEAAVTAADPAAYDPAFDTTDYIGAVRDANDTWYAGWTCNSATANFGPTSTACTSLPSLAD